MEPNRLAARERRPQKDIYKNVESVRRNEWQVTRIAKARAFEPEWYSTDWGHPERIDAGIGGSATRDLAQGTTGRWLFPDEHPEGSYLFVWIEKGRRLEAPLKILANTASVTIRRSDVRPNTYDHRIL